MIDDEPDEIRARALELQDTLHVILRAPQEVLVDDLRRAKVILLDYQLNHWTERDEAANVCLRPASGVAVAAVLRSYFESRTTHQRRAFAVYSGKLHELAGGLTSASREHVIARAINLEWVFAKQGNKSSPDLSVQLISLAKAVSALPRKWPSEADKAVRQVNKLLGLGSASEWADRARGDVEQCHPPSHAIAVATTGLAFVRWLLHRVLPYPCFLLDNTYLAARIGVTPQSLELALGTDLLLSKRLRRVAYRGILSEFLGRRWWRAGVEHLLWRLTAGQPFDRERLQDAVATQLSAALEPFDGEHPVVRVDEAFRPSVTLIELRNAVEVQPDDWPPYAHQAWVDIHDAHVDTEIRALVVQADQHRLAK